QRSQCARNLLACPWYVNRIVPGAKARFGEPTMTDCSSMRIVPINSYAFRQLAERLSMEGVEKRASNLISMWHGEAKRKRHGRSELFWTVNHEWLDPPAMDLDYVTDEDLRTSRNNVLCNS